MTSDQFDFAEPNSSVIAKGCYNDKLDFQVMGSNTAIPKTVVSLFAGAGGLDLGLTQSGNRIIWANDNDSDSCETYAQNIGEHIFCGDIRGISDVVVPQSDVIVGGFPCQGFSVANKFRSESDERNELYLEFLRLLNAKKPKWFVAENVSGIMSLGGGEVFKMILEDFEKCGYRIRHRLENMADFGVPQTRKRVIILGTRNDLPTSADLSHPTNTHSKTGTLFTRPWVTMGEALTAFQDASIEGDLYSSYSLKIRNFVGHRETKFDQPCPTILARGNGKGGVNATPHPNKLRRLSVMESAVMQSFPTWYVFKGSMSSRYRQVGNAVPPLYGLRLGEVLLNLKG
jgi:DNA (cytosine-5)-methyltransferase 1